MKFNAIHNLRTRICHIDLNEATEAALKARGNDISELNRDQLREGKTANGLTLPPYSANSVSKFGKQPGPIKLLDTGAFYEGIKPEFAKTDFTMNGKDQKTDMLQDRYGDDIVGLSKDSIEELAQDSLGQIQFEIRKRLGI